MKYQKDLRFYVPTHSPVKLHSVEDHEPEAELISIPTVDGYISADLGNTSREANVYEGVYKRAYL